MLNIPNVTRNSLCTAKLQTERKRVKTKTPLGTRKKIKTFSTNIKLKNARRGSDNQGHAVASPILMYSNSEAN